MMHVFFSAQPADCNNVVLRDYKPMCTWKFLCVEVCNVCSVFGLCVMNLAVQQAGKVPNADSRRQK